MGSLLLCRGLCRCPPSQRDLYILRCICCHFGLREWAVSLHPTPLEILFLNSLQILLPDAGLYLLPLVLGPDRKLAYLSVDAFLCIDLLFLSGSCQKVLFVFDILRFQDTVSR